MKKLLAKLAGFVLKKKLGLKEDHEMEDKKKWWKSTGVWSGIVITILGLYELVDMNIGPAFGFTLPVIPGWLLAFLGALGVYGRVKASKKIG